MATIEKPEYKKSENSLKAMIGSDVKLVRCKDGLCPLPMRSRYGKHTGYGSPRYDKKENGGRPYKPSTLKKLARPVYSKARKGTTKLSYKSLYDSSRPLWAKSSYDVDFVRKGPKRSYGQKPKKNAPRV